MGSLLLLLLLLISCLMSTFHTSMIEALPNRKTNKFVHILRHVKNCIAALENINEVDYRSAVDDEDETNGTSDVLRVDAPTMSNISKNSSSLHDNDSDDGNNDETVLFQASSLPTLDFHVGNELFLSSGNFGEYSIGFMKKTVERTPFKFFEMHIFYPKEPSTSTCFPSVAALHPVQVFHASFVSDWASYCRFWASHGMICFYSNERY